MRGHNGAPADSGGGGDSCKSTSDMCQNDTRNMNNTRDNEEDEVNNNLRKENESEGSTTRRRERRLNPEAEEFVPRDARARPVREERRGSRQENVRRGGGNQRLARRQQRSGRWRNHCRSGHGRSKQQRRAERRQQRRERRRDLRREELQRGQDELRAARNPGSQDIRSHMLRQPAPAMTRTARRNARRQEAEQIAATMTEAQSHVDSMMKNWTADSYGWMDDKKPDGVIRLLWENVNSLKVVTDPNLNRVRCIDEMRKRLQADVLAMCETNCTWGLAPVDRQFHFLFGQGEDRLSRAAYNRNDKYPPKSQYGGTALMAFGRLTGFSGGNGEDETNLGRWTWMRFKGEGKNVRVISAYRPVKSSRVRRRGADLTDRLGTVWEQQVRHFGDMDVDPRKRFDEDLLTELSRWKDEGDEIILMMDANQHIYDGKLGRSLRSDLQLVDAYYRMYDDHAPNSHHTGTIPIAGIFTSPGVNLEAVFVGRHGLGQGDHRLWAVDVTMQSCLGTETPTPKRVQGRGLRVNKARSYNKELESLCRTHRLSEKLDTIEELEQVIADCDSDASFQISLADDLKNTFDRQHRELQLSAEKKCSKQKSCSVPFSDESDIWLKRRATLRRLETMFLHGGDRSRASKSLRTACSHHGLDPPHQWNLEKVQTELKVVRLRLDRLKKEPKKRADLLRRRYKNARSMGRAEAASAIQQIMRAEEQRNRWVRPKRTFGKKRSLPASRVLVPSADGQGVIHSDQQPFENAIAEHLGVRFRTARSASLRATPLHDEIGWRATNATSQQILHGEYEFPSEVDESTRLLMEQMALVFARTDGKPIDVVITDDDFKHWKSADEKTGSSRSKLHFGHYMAQAESAYLTSIQVRKLNLVLSRGVPLERWLHGLTVLLEKVAGKIDIDKLRAICLYEADFNWILKLIFSKRMIANARKHELLPDEIFAVPRSGSIPAVVSGILWTDIARTSNRHFAVNSVDLGQCYDAVDHSMASLSMQSFGVPPHIVNMGLEVLQTMNFWLTSAFGECATPFGGSLDDPTMGLGQGSGWAPAAWTALSTAIIAAYKVKEMYTTISAVWFNVIVTLAAMMFVDDMNQFLRAFEGMSEGDFIEFTQRALDIWGSLVLATGGYLKPSKCHAHFVIVYFRNGRPVHRQVHPPQPFSIPQKGGGRADIECLDPKSSSKLLGFHADLHGSGIDHLEAIYEKGMTWAALSNSAGFLTRADRWLSFFFQLRPSLTYALEAFCADPKWIEDKQHKIFYACLSKMGINRNILRRTRTLPHAFGGLGLFDLNIEILGRRLHFIRQWWGTDTNVGRIMHAAYESFMKDHGLAEDVFSKDFEKYGPLSRPGFFKHTWQLCHYYQINLQFIVDPCLQSSRLDDEPFMEKVIRISDPPLPMKDLQSINTVRRFKHAYMFTDILSVDGTNVHPMMLTSTLRGTSRGEFPLERPSPSDFDLWKVVLRRLTSVRFAVAQPLPPLVSVPHNHDGWFMTAGQERLVQQTDDGRYLVFGNRQDRQLRRPIYTRLGDGSIQIPEHELLFIASVTDLSEDGKTVRLHSAAPYPRPAQQTHATLLDVLQSWDNSSLWNDVKIDDDGWWIETAVVNGTLLMVSDGSFMEHKSRRHSSCGFRLICKRTKKRAECGWVDEHSLAGCYRGELLGAIGVLLLLKAGTSRLIGREDVDLSSIPLLRYLCDNKGVDFHGNDPDRKLMEKQTHIDLLLLIRWLVRDSPISIRFEYIESHMNDIIPYQDLSFEQQQNVDMDSLAKGVLKRGLRSGNVIDPIFPFMYLLITDGSESMASSPISTLYHKEGERTARQLYSAKNILTDIQFDRVDWENFDRTTKTEFLPNMRAWYAKHIWKCNGSMSRLNLIDPIKYPCPSCPCCSCPIEDKDHIILCPDEGRTKLYKDGVTKLDVWLRQQRTDPLLRRLIRQYLSGRSQTTMMSLLRPGTQAKYVRLAEEHDDLGWTNFIEGRISRKFFEIQLQFYVTKRSRKSAGKWTAGLIERLIGLIHSQWLYRNSQIHYAAHYGGETRREYDEIMRTISHLVADTDPEDLLPEDSKLMEIDFNQLAKANSNVRRNWASAVVAARTAVRNLNFDGDSDSDDAAPRRPQRSDDAAPRRPRRAAQGGTSRPAHRSSRQRSRPQYQTQIERRGERRRKTYAVVRERGQLTITDMFSRSHGSQMDAEGSQQYRRRRLRRNENESGHNRDVT